ncbi:MAG: CoA-binding protein [Elusimicrobiota bacterium]
MATTGSKFVDTADVLFIGFSSRNTRFCSMISDAFTNSGIKVYPMNTNPGAKFSQKVYRGFSELPLVPHCAYVLLKSENTKKVVPLLIEKGVKRILFHNKKTVDPETLQICKDAGIETKIACPMMLYGKGLHKFHAFLAGVK